MGAPSAHGSVRTLRVIIKALPDHILRLTEVSNTSSESCSALNFTKGRSVMILQTQRMLLNTFLLVFIANVPLSLQAQQKQSYQPVSVAYCRPNATTDAKARTTNWSYFNYSSSDIVNDIQSVRFVDADKKIIQMGVSSPRTIANIIQAAFGNNSNNFYVINDFGKGASERSLRCIVLVELWNLMNLYGDMDVYKLIELYRSLSVYVIGNKTSQEMKFIKTKVRDFGVRNAIVRNAKETIKKALHDLDSTRDQENTSIQKLFNELSKDKLFDNVISKVIDEVYNEVPTEELIELIYNEEQKKQSAAALLYIAKNLSVKRKQLSNDEANLIMAQSLKRLKQLSDFVMDIAFVDEAISKLPHSLKNVYFADKVSFFNVGYEEYMYTPPDDIIMLPNRRYVLSLDYPKPGIRASWIVKQYEYEEFAFEFVSENKKNEYMYVYEKNQAMLWPYSVVLTFMSGGRLGTQSAWKIYPIDNYVFIKNLRYNKYLCVSDFTMEDGDRYVLAKKNGKKAELLECQWKVSKV